MDKPLNELSRERLAELARLIVKNSNGADGMHPVAIGGLQCIRLSAPDHELPHVYNPCVCVIVQGEKQVLLENETYRYAPLQFLGVSVDLPLLGQVLVASPEVPYLCLAIDLDARTIADLLAQSDDADWSRGETSRGLFVGDLDDATLESTLRLARLLDAPRDIPVLAPLVLREFHYRLLSGPYGPAVAQIASRVATRTRLDRSSGACARTMRNRSAWRNSHRRRI